MTHRCLLLLLTLLSLPGCKKADPPPVPSHDAARALNAAESEARTGWASGRGCEGLTAGKCADGASWVTRSDGLCAQQLWFDARGAEVASTAGCEGETRTFGTQPPCSNPSQRNLCAEFRPNFTLESVQLYVYRLEVPGTVDGQPLVQDELLGPHFEREMSLGPHKLSFDGHEIEIQVSQVGKELKLELKLLALPEGVTVSSAREKSAKAGTVLGSSNFDVKIPSDKQKYPIGIVVRPLVPRPREDAGN